jgi:hypothetical protein
MKKFTPISRVHQDFLGFDKPSADKKPSKTPCWSYSCVVETNILVTILLVPTLVISFLLPSLSPSFPVQSKLVVFPFFVNLICIIYIFTINLALLFLFPHINTLRVPLLGNLFLFVFFIHVFAIEPN